MSLSAPAFHHSTQSLNGNHGTRRELLLSRDGIQALLDEPGAVGRCLFFEEFGHGDNRDWFRSVHVSADGQRESAVRQEFIICTRCDKLLSHSAGGGTHFSNHRKYACPAIQAGNLVGSRFFKSTRPRGAGQRSPKRNADGALNGLLKPALAEHLLLTSDEKAALIRAMLDLRGECELVQSEAVESAAFLGFVERVFQLGFNYGRRVTTFELNQRAEPELHTIFGEKIRLPDQSEQDDG